MIMALGSLVAAGVLSMLVLKSDAATEAEAGETRAEAPARRRRARPLIFPDEVL